MFKLYTPRSLYSCTAHYGAQFSQKFHYFSEDFQFNPNIELFIIFSFYDFFEECF